MAKTKKRLVDYPEILTRRDIANLFGVSTMTVTNWTKSGELHCAKIGNVCRYFKSDILELFARALDKPKRKRTIKTNNRAGRNSKGR